MLTRQENVSPNQQYYSDSLLTKPTTAHSAFDNFAASVATPIAALNDLNSSFAQKPEGKAIHDTLNAIEMENQTPGIGWGQWGANQVASLVGYGINPIMWGFGEIGALGARGLGLVAEKAAPDAVSALMRRPLNSYLGEPMAKWLPEQVGKEGAEKTLSAGLVSQKTIDTFGTFAGSGVPIGIVNNFNQDTGHINWGGVARDAGEMGAFGIAIGSVPFAWGILRGKVNRGLGKDPQEPVTNETLSEALAKGNITPEEHQWYTDYLDHQKNPQDTDAMSDLTKRATDIVNRNGQRANAATDEVPFNILTPENVKNVLNTVPDQLVADIPETYKTALSDFLIHNRLDEIRENPEMLDGVRGYVDHINQKLGLKSFKLAESDKILDDHILKGVKENMPFSQKELFKHMRQAGFEASHMSQLPVTIPENMISHLKIAERINQLKVKLKDEQKKIEKTDLKKFNIGETHEQGTDWVNIKSEHGRINLRLYKDKSARVTGVKIPEFNGKYSRGKGHGKSLYMAAIKYAESKGLKFYSDLEVSPAAMRVYESLERLGYKFKKNPTTYLKESDGRSIQHYKVTDGKPIFELISSPTVNKQTLRRVAELEAKLPKILTPKEELEHIRKTLVTDKGLPKKWERSNAYHRLLDLAHVWHNARTLLDRVHMERDYNAQEAFKTLADHVIKVADANMPRLAKPDNVVNYLKARIESTVTKKEPIAFAEDKARAASDIPQDADSVLSEQQMQVENSAAKDLAKEFSAASDKFKEFKSSEGIFKNLISCVMGGMNG